MPFPEGLGVADASVELPVSKARVEFKDTEGVTDGSTEKLPVGVTIEPIPEITDELADGVGSLIDATLKRLPSGAVELPEGVGRPEDCVEGAVIFMDGVGNPVDPVPLRLGLGVAFAKVALPEVDWLYLPVRSPSELVNSGPVVVVFELGLGVTLAVVRFPASIELVTLKFPVRGSSEFLNPVLDTEDTFRLGLGVTLATVKLVEGVGPVEVETFKFGLGEMLATVMFPVGNRVERLKEPLRSPSESVNGGPVDVEAFKL